MSSEKWPYADEFSQLIRQFHEVGRKVSLVFSGSTEAFRRLYDATNPPPSVVANHPHTNGEFVCWLQLPLDWEGAQWSFGRVICRDAPAGKFDEFRRAAERAGACLRNHRRFHEWLTPIMDYTQHGNRLSQLRDREDISWWLALLLMKPEVLKPQVKHGAVAVEILDAATLSQRAIRSWKLATELPTFPVQQQVVQPFGAQAVPESKPAKSKKRGRKRASDEKIRNAINIYISYHKERRSPEDFCVWWNSDKKAGRITTKSLSATLSWVRNRLIPEHRIPAEFANKMEWLQQVKSKRKKAVRTS